MRPRLTSLSLALTVAALACGERSSPGPGPAPTPPGQVAPTAVDTQLQAIAATPIEGWYGIYMMGKKVGHGHMWLRPSATGEPGAYASGFTMSMAVSGGGNANQLALAESRYYAATPPHALVETRFSTSAQGFSDERKGTPTADGKMRITRTLGGKAEPAREVPGTKEDLVAQLHVTPLELREGDVGKVRELSLWSWDREADEAVTVTLKGLDERMRAGVRERVGRIDMHYPVSGVKGQVVVGQDGTLLEMTLGASLLLKLEERAVAESGIDGLDILGTSVKSPELLGRPSSVGALELEVSGPKDLALPASRVRKVEALGVEGEVGRWRLTLTRGPGDEVKADERALALAADATIDATHPAVVARAKALTEGLGEPREKVEAIGAWVFATLDKKLATHLPTASTILEQKVGDCSEHTWLTVALLRAAGIPARPLYGIAYLGDGEPVFGYHAWTEVALPAADGVERWLAIDSTWGQTEADATHIVLGTTFGEVAASIGGLTIEKARKL